jgi:Fe-S-cluster-containing hydrogenase component 2
MALTRRDRRDSDRHRVLAEGHIVPNAARCVQCGVCAYNCPAGIDTRRHAWLGIPVTDGRCLVCGECVMRCPRGALQIERTAIFAPGERGR